jgi:hypothetical protein
MCIADPSILASKIAATTSTSISDSSTLFISNNYSPVLLQKQAERRKHLHAEDEILKVACEMQLR